MRWSLACVGLALLFGLALVSVVVRGRVTALRHRLAVATARCGSLSAECALLEARVSTCLRAGALDSLWKLHVGTAE